MDEETLETDFNFWLIEQSDEFIKSTLGADADEFSNGGVCFDSFNVKEGTEIDIKEIKKEFKRTGDFK